ncbi:integrase core domain-containing protein [Streptomyces sp. 900105755]
MRASTPTYLRSALEEHRRLAYTEALEDEKAATVVAFCHRAVAFFAVQGVTPVRRVITDSGGCCRARTRADALAKAGTKHKRTRTYTPQSNGKVGRFNDTVGREWANVRDCTSEQGRRAALADFLNCYNHERRDAARGGGSPVSRRTVGSDFRVTSEQSVARRLVLAVPQPRRR